MDHIQHMSAVDCLKAAQDLLKFVDTDRVRRALTESGRSYDDLTALINTAYVKTVDPGRDFRPGDVVVLVACIGAKFVDEDRYETLKQACKKLGYQWHQYLATYRKPVYGRDVQDERELAAQAGFVVRLARPHLDEKPKG